MQDESFGIIPLFIKANEPVILLVQHRAGHWGFPKGHAEKNESALETACREFEEETGISDYLIIDSHHSFQEQYVFQRDGQKIKKTVGYFLARVDTQSIHFQESELQDAEWLSFRLASKTLDFSQSKVILQQVKDYLELANFFTK